MVLPVPIVCVRLLEVLFVLLFLCAAAVKVLACHASFLCDRELCSYAGVDKHWLGRLLGGAGGGGRERGAYSAAQGTLVAEMCSVSLLALSFRSCRSALKCWCRCCCF